MQAKFEFAQMLIREAVAYVKKRMTEDLEIEEKSSFNDLVTNIDKDTQDLMVRRIQEAYPDDFILGEENDLYHDVKEGRVWVLDPIDGTVNFIAQGRDFAVMMAYYEEGIGKFGLIYDVSSDLLFCGGGPFQVTCNGQPLPAYQPRPLNRQLLGANGSMYANNYRGLANLASHLLGVRVLGSAGISMSRVLKGQLLGYFSSISPWDYAAASIMGEKLGYQLLTMTGEPLDYKSRQAVMFIPQAESDKIQSYLGSRKR
ncbi:inositol monophosphatase family protein [Streptococcus downei]|uniref:Inositol monophosphatase family protein n=1 Tax=Streptococcus downei MFe28 TaxID=764290 RepID=A0A380JFQ0_STRDO|nr:inositol monophosphatase family protein [Streptococcus downei]EFQ56585.1 inositol monophosphatase family protein [Streptococcus downei F0415]SUN36171.1 inositol monophosphatase family protein [Streptococcus downei MFe28]